MKLAQHSPHEFGAAIKSLLPPGAAWDWPDGGLGMAILNGAGAELSRVEAGAQQVLDMAPEAHKPVVDRWHIDRYREVANAALNGLTEIKPRRSFTVGSHVGDRCWSAAASETTFDIPMLRVDHLVGPLRVGSRAGDCCWGTRSRYVLRVRYYRSVVDPAPIAAALRDFKQAHVFLWFEDITGVGGLYAAN
jgi:hypothetical protein